jgi:hypothetical protein
MFVFSKDLLFYTVSESWFMFNLNRPHTTDLETTVLVLLISEKQKHALHVASICINFLYQTSWKGLN